jgi:hypothetical protein
MRITNEGWTDQAGWFAELARLQADFQTRLTEETLRYLRAMQGVFTPTSPGTVVQGMGESELHASGTRGAIAVVRPEIENRQQVHAQVTPTLTPLIGERGTTWFAAAEVTPPSALVGPGEVLEVVISLPLPNDLPSGTYRGTLVLQGFRQEGVPVVIDVVEPAAESSESSTSGQRSVRT